MYMQMVFIGTGYVYARGIYRHRVLIACQFRRAAVPGSAPWYLYAQGIYRHRAFIDTGPLSIKPSPLSINPSPLSIKP